MNLEVIKVAFIIFAIRVVDITISSYRTILMIKGQKLLTFITSFIETILYVYGLDLVLQRLDNFLNLFVYALGFAVGNYIGMLLDEKVGIGYETFVVIPSTCNGEITNKLREVGYIVTTVKGEGYKGEKDILYVTIKRKDLSKFEKFIKSFDPSAFYFTLETKRARKFTYLTKH
ncbi:MAG TPA: DUF5698 domain-containing protein [Caldisericia bacterium]|nr:DUF5698 domain-containing protein [Caldisericia bacterium]HOL82770.1 DUF5698 domain-containing protein [Caldisericia bacterium]HON82601.1 DUF5698 domain-containing protein [Caldisericia bacterium]HPC57086.1 DUF5698 domain-containing protein [Caldisericia bacterium]HPP44043.1 DUF5698 domain-containing protein [Caldisericia bacterium]